MELNIPADVPGEKSKKLFKLKNEFIPQGISTTHPIFVKKASGPFLEDVDGNIYIDFCSGISTINVGHCHPKIVNAIKKQSEKFTHTCFMVVPYEQYVELAIKLSEITPNGVDMTVFFNSGAEAVENAIKIARYYTKKSSIITFSNAFHGRTLLTMALTSKVEPYKLGFGPFISEIYRVPYAYCYRCQFNLEYPDCGLACVEYLRKSLGIEIPLDVAALIVEPVQGEGGFIVPPKEYLRELRKFCDEHSITMIVDEVQTGFGRTGKMFAIEHSKIVPDIMALAKSIAAGLPLAAVVGKREIMNSVHPGGLGGTFGGNPIACTAAIEVIEIIKNNLPNAIKIGKILKRRCMEFSEKYEFIGDVRGLGPMVGIEIVRDRKTKEPNKKLCEDIIHKCLKKGLLIMKAGIYNNVIRFLPPLVAKTEIVEQAMDIFEDSLSDV